MAPYQMYGIGIYSMEYLLVTLALPLLEEDHSRDRRQSDLRMQLAYMGKSLRLSGRMSCPAGDWLEHCLR